MAAGAFAVCQPVFIQSSNCPFSLEDLRAKNLIWTWTKENGPDYYAYNLKSDKQPFLIKTLSDEHRVDSVTNENETVAFIFDPTIKINSPLQ